MQNSSTIPHSWQEFVWLTVAAILGYGATHLPSIFRKKQNQADVEKTRAETRGIDAETVIHSGEFMIELMKVSAQATLDVERLRNRADFLQSRLEQVEAERDLLQIQVDRHVSIGLPPAPD